MSRSLSKLLIALLALGQLLGPVTQANSGFGPGPGLGQFGSGLVAGVKVGSGGVLVSTQSGATVNLACMMISGLNYGPTTFTSGIWAPIAAVTSAQWAAGIQQWYNTLTTAGKPYGQINCIRIAMSPADWLGLTGIDPYNNSGSAAAQYRAVCTDTNGRTVYSAGSSGGGCGTGPGNEVAGNSSVYQSDIETTVSNILGATSTLGYQMYVILVDQWSAPVWSTTGQILLPLDQPAMPSPADIPMFQQLAAIYGNDPRILIEPYNEPYGTNLPANYNGVESAYLGNGNGNPVTFNFPTGTTSPGGTNGGYNMSISGGGFAMGGGQTAEAISFQQIANAYRTAGGHNVLIIGDMVADACPQCWVANGGHQAYTDTYTISGIAQSAVAFHAYSNPGGVSLFQTIQTAGMPIIGTEAGSMVGDSGTGGGYSYWRAHNWSYTWCCWAAFQNPPLPNIYTNDGSPFSSNYTIQGESPWKNPNVPVGNTGSDTSQIPTGSN